MNTSSVEHSSLWGMHIELKITLLEKAKQLTQNHHKVNCILSKKKNCPMMSETDDHLSFNFSEAEVH